MYKKRWLTPNDLVAELGISKSTQAKKRSKKLLLYSKWGGMIEIR